MKRVPFILSTAAILMAAGMLLKASSLQVPSGTWIATGPMNSERAGAAAVLLEDGRILVTGGNDASGPTNLVDSFSASGSFSPATPMNIPRSGQVAVLLQDGRVLVAGGMTTGGAVTNTVEIYDPTTSVWTNVIGGMVEARTGHTAALLHDGRVLVAGGANGTLISSTIEIFDPGSNRFAAAGRMSSPRTQHAMTVLADGRVLIVGGNNGTAPVGSTDIYDPVANIVSTGPKLSVPRFGHSATTLLNGLVVVIGGNNGNANPATMDVAPAEIFDPSAVTPAFTALASNLATPREGHLAFLLPNNNSVLIVAGTSSGTRVSSAELFTPQESSHGVWSYVFGPTGSLATARSSTTGAPNQLSTPASVMRRNGLLLIAGGMDPNGNVLNSSEAYGFATVQTNQGDYPPGTTVVITGSGWQPGEAVKLQLVESPLMDMHTSYAVTADSNGNISDSSFATDAHDLDIKFTLTAAGSISRAQMTFTDSSSTNVTLNHANTPLAAFGKSSLSTPMSVNAGGTNTVAFATVWVDEAAGASGTPTFTVTATYGGQAMTSAGATSYDYHYAPKSSQVFYLVNPPTGTNTLVVNATASSGTIQEVAGNLISFNGVSQTAPVRPGTYQALHSTTAATVGSFSATIASNTSDLTLGAIEQTFHFAATPTNQTSDGVNGADYAVGSDHATTAAATVTDTWSFTNSYAYYAYVGFSIQAAIGGGSGSLPTLTYAANPASRSYGAANPAFTGTATGFVGSDTQASATTGTLTFSSTATSTSGVGIYAINGAGLAAINGKYTFAQAAANATALTITQATPTVTVSGGTIPYDGNPHAATAMAVGVDGHTAVAGSFSFSYTPPGNSTVPTSPGTYVISATFTSSDPNYSNGTGTGSITITTSALTLSSSTVTLNNRNTPLSAFGKSSLSTPMSVNAGGTNTVAFATVWVDEAAGASGTPTFTVTATYGGQVMTSAGATSYDYHYAPKSSQVFYLVNPPTGTNTLVVNATASSGTIQEVAGNLISFNGVSPTAPVRPGTYQALHSPTAVTVGSFSATIASNTSDLTLGSIEQTFHFAATPTNQTSDGVNGADFAVGSDHATTAAATVTDTWSFTNTYAYYAYVGFSIQAASSASSGPLPTLTYTANPASRSYGGANPAFAGTVTGFVGSDTQANATTGTLTFGSTATSTSGVGSYAINGAGLAANNGKYTFAQAIANATALTITQATPTVTVSGGTIPYDGNPHAATATAVGVDGHTAVAGSFSFNYTPPGNSTTPTNTGTYVVSATFTSSDPNYSNATGTTSISIVAAIGTGGALGLYQFQIDDSSNTPSAPFPKTTAANDLLLAYGSTQLSMAGFTSVPTLSDGTTMTACASPACNYTTSDGVLNTVLWMGGSPGGTTPTLTLNTTGPVSSIGGMGLEITGANTLDQIATSQLLGDATSGGTGTLVSSTITTTQPNEILVCLAGEAAPTAGGADFVSVQNPWTGVAFGNQAIAYVTEANPGTYSCTVNLGDGTEDYAITIASFYYASNTGPAVLTYHNDNGRTGQNQAETILTTANVNSTNFGRLGSLPTDGLVDAEPLYVSNLTIGSAAHNVIFVATEHDSVYAFDATTLSQLWKVSLLGSTETTSDPVHNCSQVTPEIGITATPVIDLTAGAHGTIFVVAMSKDASGNYHQRLHALDLTTGAEQAGSPAEIAATYPGTGDNSTNGQVVFDPMQYEERAGLLLLNGAIYTGWTSHCDVRPYTGWIMGYSESTLHQTSVINVTPNGHEGAIWMAGAGLAADSSNNIYFLMGNGTFDSTLSATGQPASGDYGNSFMKLSTSGNALAVADYFTMYDTSGESGVDEDLGSGGALVLPDLKDNLGNKWQLALGAGKDGSIYVVNRSIMGGLQSTQDNQIYQEIDGQLGGFGTGGIFSIPAYFNNTVYYGPVGLSMKAFTISNATLSATPSSQSGAAFGYPGTTPSVSANGSTNGIVWAIQNGATGVLHAYDATNLATELYNSNMAGTRDQFPTNSHCKFVTPMIANGQVFVGTATGVVVFGLLNP